MNNEGAIDYTSSFSESHKRNCRPRYHRRRQRIRAVYRAIAFVVLFGSASLIKNGIINNNVLRLKTTFESREKEGYKNEIKRRLSGDVSGNLTESCNTGEKVNQQSILIIYVAGVLYMFVAIAIVCDEFFVPALEEIASENYMNLSMDVAGATLMAAGGSAPELFTSLIGTFQGSEVGFGTIVGSAVFNVLFVIGMCAIFSKEVLSLTWWPLARDCAYYSIGLLVLAFFCGYSSPGEIELWEASVQLCLYVGYVVIMKFNSKIWTYVNKRNNSGKISTEEKIPRDLASSALGTGKPSTFRAGLLNFFMGNGALLDRVGIAMVTKISGDVDTVFKKLDQSGDGFIDNAEFHSLVEALNTVVSEEEINEAIQELDENNDGKIDLKEFTRWYIKSEIRLNAELKSTFDTFDADKSGTIDGIELRHLMKELGTEVKDEDIQATLEEAHIHGPSCEISFEEFKAWYTQSKYSEERMFKVEMCADEVVEPISSHLKPPKKGSIIAYLRWALLFPIVFVLCLTIPDTKQPGNSKLCFFSFALSIAWIGGFTYFMVAWADVIGNSMGIPMVLMGLTVLAAGTSVPDLLSSVIVARMGEGDMAVSSSIGSNIFDITVGLPVPWILFCLTTSGEKTVPIGTNGMATSIIILLIMLLCIVIMIHFSGWKMTKSLGGGMFLLYFAYLAQAIIRQLPFEKC